MIKRRTIFSFLALVLIVKARTIEENDELPRNYNIHYQKSGELLKAASSNVPYSSSYDIEEDNYQPNDYVEAESANFGTYDLGNTGGQYISNGYQGGIQGGLQSGHGFGGGLNQFGGVGYNDGFRGYSGSGIGYTTTNLGGSGFGGNFVGKLGGGLGTGLGNLGSGVIGQQGFYSGGHGGGHIHRPIVTGGAYVPQTVQVAGGYVDKNQYGAANKNTGDENLEKVNANVGSSVSQGSQGFNQGATAQSSAKGDSGFYKDETANKNQAGDGKQYQGATNFDKEGKNGNSENAQKSHKKGHVTKGFKSSHRKDEEEKTETFYDEAHDEADRKNFDTKQGSYGENSQASFKGGQEKEILDSKAQGKQGHFNNQNKLDDSSSKKAEFGEKNYKDNSEQLHKVNGLGAQTVLGQQESSGEYQSKKPYGILPINGDRK